MIMHKVHIVKPSVCVVSRRHSVVVRADDGFCRDKVSTPKTVEGTGKSYKVSTLFGTFTHNFGIIIPKTDKWESNNRPRMEKRSRLSGRVPRPPTRVFAEYSRGTDMRQYDLYVGCLSGMVSYLFFHLFLTVCVVPSGHVPRWWRRITDD